MCLNRTPLNETLNIEITSAYCPNSLMHTQERFANYRVGGYHLICLNDALRHGRYTIRQKLVRFANNQYAHDGFPSG